MDRLAPIFIISNRRSGSTLLRLMLTSHSNIVIPPEGDFLVLLGWEFDRRSFDDRTLVKFTDRLFEMENIADWEFEREPLLERLLSRKPRTYPAVIDQVYQEYDRIKNGGRSTRWGDKTTWYANYLRQIKGYFPDMLVIHLVRDPRAVAASYQNTPHLPSDPVDAGLDWTWHESRIKQSQRYFASDRWLQVRYEDLAARPVQALTGVCEFIGEPFQEGMLAFWEKNREEQLEPERHMGWKQMTLEKVSTSQIDSWKSQLTQTEKQKINRLTHRTRLRYGYHEAESRPSWLSELYWTMRRSAVILSRLVLLNAREMKARAAAVFGK